MRQPNQNRPWQATPGPRPDALKVLHDVVARLWVNHRQAGLCSLQVHLDGNGG